MRKARARSLHDASAEKRIIAHADMDAFYASVEQLDNPRLSGLPVIVAGPGPRGVVTSASYQARSFGVHSAMPTVEARRLCPRGVFLPGRRDRYLEVSRQIRRVFERFSPLVEALSLDEAFLDLSGTARLLGPPIEVARALKLAVRRRTGLVVSVGVGPNKTAAKILSSMSKPDGLLYLGSEYLSEFLRPLGVKRLWGVGRVTLDRMHRAGIRTIGDLADFDPAGLRKLLGSLGPHLHQLANGCDPRPVVADWQRKSYSEENTFERDLAPGSSELTQALMTHGQALGGRLRRDQVGARTITLKLKLARPRPRAGRDRYPVITRSLSLASPTNDGATIALSAKRLLSQIGRSETVRLAGIQLHNLEPTNPPQPGLFDIGWHERDRRARLNRALDRVTNRFGNLAIARGPGHLDHSARKHPTK